MPYGSASVSERRTLPPAVAVSVVAFALEPPADVERGEAPAAERPAPDATAPDATAPRGPGNARAASRGTTIWVPLVRRTREPFLGQWALPGGPTEWDETLSDTALRTLRAAVRRDPGSLEQLYSFGSVERSAEAQRLVTIAYWALYGERELAAPARAEAPGPHADRDTAAATGEATAPRRWDDPEPAVAPGGSLAATGPADGNVRWFSADRLPPLAFDHAEIVAHALARLRARTEYAAVAHRFLGSEFTLSQLRTVTEAVLGESVDPANFRRQALARGGLVDTGRLDSGGAHRPARLYRFSDPGSAGSDSSGPSLFTPSHPRSSS